MRKRIIIAGGGTGGHIFPAIAIANALKKLDNDLEFLFIGAKGKMEMQKIPEAGYSIEGIDIAGFNRSSLIKNIGLPFKILKSFLQVRKIFSAFKPDAVIGVGGYSSYPVLRYAQTQKLPTFIHESNSFAGKANTMLGRKASLVFVASDGMELFFPANKIRITGNPVRQRIVENRVSREEGIQFFGLDSSKKTVLVIGGSLGAKTINEAIDAGIPLLLKNGLQLIWQTGKSYVAKAVENAVENKSVWVNDFISEMEYAFSAADIVVSRAGAMTIAELCIVKKPVIFVPFPFAAEDHQTVNARKLVEKKAGWMLSDAEAKEKLVKVLIELAGNADEQAELKHNLAALAIRDADERIARYILGFLK